jgi:hypothetical protein
VHLLAGHEVLVVPRIDLHSREQDALNVGGGEQLADDFMLEKGPVGRPQRVVNAEAMEDG